MCIHCVTLGVALGIAAGDRTNGKSKVRRAKFLHIRAYRSFPLRERKSYLVLNNLPKIGLEVAQSLHIT